MDLEYSAAESTFRDDVRAFIRANLPRTLAAKVFGHKRLTRDDFLRWHRTLHTRGWSAPTWPKEFGGPGLDRRRAAHLRRGKLLRPAHRRSSRSACAWWRRCSWLTAARRSSSTSCRASSRASTGGARATASPARAPTSPRSRRSAARRGDVYVVNGQKTWNTLGHLADWMFCLVRTTTEGRSQEGISFLLIDMKTPGISVRPIALIDGEHEVNEVWLDNVEVPVDEPRRRGEQGLDLCEVPADARAREYRAARRIEARAAVR